MNNFKLKAILPIGLTFIVLLTFIPIINKNIFLALVEFIVEFFIFVQLMLITVKSSLSKMNWSALLICASMFCIFLADTIYSLSVLSITSRFTLLADYSYSFFALLLLVFLFIKLNIFNRSFNEWGWIFLIALFFDSIVSYKFLLSLYLSITSDSLYWKINGTCYMGLTIVIFALILPFIFRISDRKTYWFLNLLLLLLTADITIRYQDAFIDNHNFSWAEPAWASAFIWLAWLAHLPEAKIDCILIDDDPLIHSSWKMVAYAKKKLIETFLTYEDFIKNANSFSKNVPIYIDVNLAKNVRGEQVARILSELGFDRIYLTTGYDSKDFTHLPFIKGVIGKYPPFA